MVIIKIKLGRPLGRPLRSNGMYRSDSFDRFGDDLCELLLSYLSIYNKIRFQSISKQWKRLIFNKQKRLSISCVKDSESFDTISISKIRWFNYNKVLKSLFEKFRFINELNINFYVNDEVLKLINNNCIHLEKVQFYTHYNKELITEFGLKFGQRLKVLNINSLNNKQLKSVLYLTTNLRSIYLFNNNNVQALIESFLPFLEEIMNLCVNNLKDFILLTDKYRRQLKKISFHSIDETLPVNDLLMQLSRYENLESLDLSRLDINEEIDKGIIRIGKNCKKLKKLYLEFIEFKSNSNLFEICGTFHTLKKLIIRPHIKIRYNRIGNISSLRSCQNLKSLLLFNCDLYYENLDDIHIYLPQLKIFYCNDVRDKTLHNLSKLQNLSKLIIDSKTITNSGVRRFIKNSPNIKTLHINRIFINTTTIEVFTKRANNNPKILYEISDIESYGIVNKRITYTGISGNLIIKRNELKCSK